MKKGEITIDTTKIQRITRDYYKQLYANKMDNLEEEIENVNRPITSTRNETVIKNFPTNKSPGPDGFTGEFYQAFRYKLDNTYPSQTLPKIAEGGISSNSFY